MDGIMKDLSFVGKTTSQISLIISIIVSVILLFLSYIFLTKKEDFVTIDANIKTVKKCTKYYKTTSNRKTINTNKLYNCIITVEYTVNNKLYINDILTNSNIDYINYNVKKLAISYNKKNPDEIRLPTASNKTVGFIFLAIAIIVLGASYYSYYLAKNSSIVATTQGINSLTSIIGLNKNKY
jgi:hypothetical protein